MGFQSILKVELMHICIILSNRNSRKILRCALILFQTTMKKLAENESQKKKV